MSHERPIHGEAQDIVARLITARADDAELQRSQAEARKQLPALREQISGFVRKAVAPPQLETIYESWGKKRADGRDFFIEPVDADPDVLQLASVQLITQVPLNEEEPLAIKLWVSSYPKEDESSPEIPPLSVIVGVDERITYELKGNDGLVLTQEDQIETDRRGDVVKKKKHHVRFLEEQDVVDLMYLFQLAKDQGLTTVYEPYQAKS